MTLADLCSTCWKWNSSSGCLQGQTRVHIQGKHRGPFLLSPCSLPTYMPPFLPQNVQKTSGRRSWCLHKGKEYNWHLDYTKTASFHWVPLHSARKSLRSRFRARHRLTIILWTLLSSAVNSKSQNLCFVLSKAVMRLKWDNVCKALCKL